MHNILLVEDSPESYQLVKRALGHSTHLDWVQSLAEGRKLLSKKEYDAILLDVGLPDGDGYRLCSALQEDERLKATPVIFLTAKNTVTDKVMGFAVGGDDFITKPFEPMELRARLDALFRKRDRNKAESDLLKRGDIELDKRSQRVQVFDSGKTTEVDLTPLEFKLLLTLSKDVNRVYSRNELLETVWGDRIHVDPRSVDTHISKLRRKLGTKSETIQAVHGAGYRFTLDRIENVSGAPYAGHSLLG